MIDERIVLMKGNKGGCKNRTSSQQRMTSLGKGDP
jgi:hypothetical protein